jgi:hypothetical protein
MGYDMRAAMMEAERLMLERLDGAAGLMGFSVVRR